MNPYQIIIFFCGLAILSYVFDLAASWFRFPSVLLLMGTGIALRQLAPDLAPRFETITNIIPVLGTVGLIMIVLEGALDLSLTREKWPVIGKGAASALVFLLGSTVAVVTILLPLFEGSLHQAVLYAVPLSVISSAVVLPSIAHIAENKREFTMYEASLSDIFGILLFNYFAFSQSLSARTAAGFLTGILSLGLLSALAAVGLAMLTVRIRRPVKFFLVLALLTLLYALGHLYHLSSLLLVLLFGLAMNNLHLLPWIHRAVPGEGPPGRIALEQLRSIACESSFLLRTYFFVLFGYQMDLGLLNDVAVFRIGGLIVLALLAVRFLCLKYLVAVPLLPELFLLPRGLVTVILFYQIPAAHQTAAFNNGVLFFVIIATNLLMAFGLVIARRHGASDRELSAVASYGIGFTRYSPDLMLPPSHSSAAGRVPPEASCEQSGETGRGLP